MYRKLLSPLGGLWLLSSLVLGQEGQATPTMTNPFAFPAIPATAAIRAPRLGITFINSAEAPIQEARYRRALELGVGWTRWPLYWQRVQPEPQRWDWSAYDVLVAQDIRYGLNINAVLLGKPTFATNGIIPNNLDAPVFSDGSDLLAAGKAINPANPWAIFVYEAVRHYKPGGDLARQQRWTQGQGIRVWEVWNEPDFVDFFQGSIRDYARMLKVAYLAAKLADPQAQVMFGGLLYATDVNWLAQVLAIYDRDPWARTYNWYMDMVAVHSYSYPWRTGWLTHYVRETLRAYRLERPVWVNETGVNLWDDYPGPTWASAESGLRTERATAQQQAWFLIQSAAYAWEWGADVVMWHQLADDCGNQPAGTTFAPDSGQFGDAFGLYRNDSSSPCFNQHPLPGTPRPAAQAYRLLAEVFGRQPFTRGPRAEVIRQDNYTLIQFERPATQERISVLWNRAFEPIEARLKAEGRSAQLYSLNGNRRLIPNAEGFYTLRLGAAQADYSRRLEAGDISAIGGEPLILVEVVGGGPGQPSATDLATTPATPAPSPTPFVLPPVEATARATVPPDEDRTPPVPFMNPLLETSPTVFSVSWGAVDDGQVVQYLVWVRVNEGEWQVWRETSQTQADYVGQPGQRYDFAVWALDAGGNWSENATLRVMATTRVE